MCFYETSHAWGRKPTSQPSYLSLQANIGLLGGQQVWTATVPRPRSSVEAAQVRDLLGIQIPCEIRGEGVRKGSQEVYGIWETAVIVQIGPTVLLASLRLSY